jgi:hypothetical protein
MLPQPDIADRRSRRDDADDAREAVTALFLAVLIVQPFHSRNGCHPHCAQEAAEWEVTEPSASSMLRALAEARAIGRSKRRSHDP